MTLGLALGLAATAACTAEPGSDDEVGTAETGETETGGEPSVCLDALGVMPEGASWEPSEIPVNDPVDLDFTVTIDPGHAQLDPAAMPKRLDPRPDAITVAGGDADFELRVLAKRLAERPDTVWLELYVLSEGVDGLANAELELGGLGGAAVWDLGRDPWSDPVAEPRFVVGHVAPGATGRAVVGVELPADAGVLALTVTLRGSTSRLRAGHSAPLAMSPDGAELWAPWPDADTLAVVDTEADARVAALELPGRPTGVAVTPDGQWILSTTAACNQLVVIDRASREIVQVFGEDQGIGRDPRHVLTSPDGRWAFVSSYVGDRVTILRRVEGGFRVEGQVALDRRPTGMAIDAGGTRLFVAHWMPRGPVVDNEAWISVIDLETLSLDDEIVIDDESNLDRTDCIAMIFGPMAPEAMTFEGAYTQLAGVFVGPSGGRGLIPAARGVPFPLLEGDPAASGVSTALSGANSPLNLIELDLREPEASQLAPLDTLLEITDRSQAFLECVASINTNEFNTPTEDPEQPGIWSYAGKASPASTSGLNTTGIGRFVTWSPDGRAAFVLGTAADHLMVLDGATLAGTHSEPMTLAGQNPIAMAFTPDGRKAYVAYANSAELGVLDTSAYADTPREPGYAPVWFSPALGGGNGGLVTFALLTMDVNGLPTQPAVAEVGGVALVDADPMDPVLRRGKVLFESSNPDKYPELAASPQATCQSCHPDGGTDGIGWATVEGERRTLPLWGGTGGRGWLHYSASHSSSEEFATTIVEERLGGDGLSAADVHALSEYVAWGIPEVQRPLVDEALAAEGQALFESQCRGCHADATYGSGGATPDHPYGGADSNSTPALFDVGTATDDANILIGSIFVTLFPAETAALFEAMRGDRALGADDPVQQILGYTPRPERARGVFKAPSLINVWENPNFFHDARYGELREVIDHFDAAFDLELSDADAAALLEYLKTL